PRGAPRVRFRARGGDGAEVRPRARGLAALARGGRAGILGRSARARLRLSPRGRHRGRPRDRRLLDARIRRGQALPARWRAEGEPDRRGAEGARVARRDVARGGVAVRTPRAPARPAAAAREVPRALTAMADPFTTRIKVRHYEVDGYRHVNHANYVHYFEAGRVEALEKIGLGLPEMQRQGYHIVAVEIAVKFLAPAHPGESLDIV